MNWGVVPNTKLDAWTFSRREQKTCRDMCVNGTRDRKVSWNDQSNEGKEQKIKNIVSWEMKVVKRCEI